MWRTGTICEGTFPDAEAASLPASYMRAGRRQEGPGSETKESLLFTESVVAEVSSLLHQFLSFHSHKAMQRGLDASREHAVGLEENSQLRKSGSFAKG